jgi:hypothetical protein
VVDYDLAVLHACWSGEPCVGCCRVTRVCVENDTMKKKRREFMCVRTHLFLLLFGSTYPCLRVSRKGAVLFSTLLCHFSERGKTTDVRVCVGGAVRIGALTRNRQDKNEHGNKKSTRQCYAEVPMLVFINRQTNKKKER